MNKKTSKHGAAKRVKTPATPRPSPPSTQITFYTTTGAAGELHHWHAMRSGKVVAESAYGYSRKEKMKHSFIKLVDSFRAGNWTASNQP